MLRKSEGTSDSQVSRVWRPKSASGYADPPKPTELRVISSLLVCSVSFLGGSRQPACLLEGHSGH